MPSVSLWGRSLAVPPTWQIYPASNKGRSCRHPSSTWKTEAGRSQPLARMVGQCFLGLGTSCDLSIQVGLGQKENMVLVSKLDEFQDQKPSEPGPMFRKPALLASNGHLVCFHLLAPVNSAVNMGVQIPVESLLSILLDMYPEMELLDGDFFVLST